MNVGVVFFCRPRRYLAARMALDEARLAAFAPDLDLAEVRAHLEAMTRIAAGDAAPGRSRGSSSPSASTGSSRRRARSSRPRRSTPGCARTRRRRSTRLWRSSWHEGDRPRAAPLDRSAPGLGARRRSRAARPTGPSRSAARSTRRPTRRSSSTRRCRTSCGRRSTSSWPSRPVVVLTTIRWHGRSRDAVLARYGGKVSRPPMPAGIDALAVRGLRRDDVLAPGAARARARRPSDRRRRGRHPAVPAVVARTRAASTDLRAALRPLLELPVEHVLCSHWDAVIGGGHAALERALRS